MNSTLPLVHRAPPHSFFPASFCGCSRSFFISVSAHPLTSPHVSQFTQVSVFKPDRVRVRDHVMFLIQHRFCLAVGFRVFCGRYISTDLSSLCPVPHNLRMSQSSQKQFCFKSSLHSHFSQFTEFLSPSPSLCCILPAASGAPVFISLGYYCELQGGNSTVVGMLSY